MTSPNGFPPVLFVGNFLSGYGASRGVCEELSDRLARRGWQVITTSSRQAPIPRLIDMLNTIWSRRREFRVAHVDVYSGNAFTWAEAACALLRRIAKPYVLTLHGGGLPEFAQRCPNRVRSLLETARAVTAPSPYLKTSLSGLRRDIQLVPNALDLACYAFRHRTSPCPKLVWLRAFHGIYNPMLAVKAAARLCREFPDLTLTMIGPDKGDGSRNAASRTAVEEGIEHRVTFLGAVPKADVPRHLDSGDLFLNTSSVDNTPVTVLEAMASGLPVVSTDVCGIPYLVQTGVEALLVPPSDPERLAGALRRVLLEPGLAEHLSSAGRQKAQSLDWSQVLPRWEQIFSESTT